MRKLSSIILFSFFIFNCSFLIVHAQPDPLVESGKVKQKTGNHDGAIYDFTSSIKKNDSEVQKYLSQLEEYDKMSSSEKAEKGIEAPLVNLNFSIPYYLRGYCYSITGKNNSALEDFNTAIKINPTYGSAYYQRGKLLWTTGKKDEGCSDVGMAGC